MAAHGDDDLELSPNRRFVSAATEADFSAWQAVQALPLNRKALLAGIVLGFAQGVAFVVLSPGGARLARRPRRRDGVCRPPG
jgi:hypothetical protein